MAKYTISNRHLPPREKLIDQRYPFADMEVGDSFLVPFDDARDIIQLRQTCYYYARKHDGYRFSVRREKKGWRIYRVQKARSPRGFKRNR